MEDRTTKFVYPVIGALGTGILLGDILGDIKFFQDPDLRTTPLLVSAAVRNTITLLAVVAIFFRKQWAAVVLLMAALFGGWRRASFLLPISDGDSWLLVHSGADMAFRALILGLSLGYLAAFLGRGGPDESRH